ncbi:SKP1-like protein 1A [Alnus glutinosa]|uniref:SKP1-like protein 1A n=1 Tax=Alnus glutinosa TaxID=3517 RepID=UPI002D765594|nr:SKP1-like protein 1A [Alnus glutinosa]
MVDSGENPIPNVGKMVKLRTADGEIFEVEEAVAMELETVKSFFDDDGVSYDTVVPLLNVTSPTFAKVIEYCRRAVEFSAKLASAGNDDKGAKEKVKEERKAFEAEFVNNESNEAVKGLVLAANYLNIKDMLSFLNQAVADRIKNKSVEYVRRFFGIENDFLPEEDQQNRQDNAWAFEDVDAD